ncbi:MAG: 50S ribosomal protein L19e [Candidatus Syntropharchaeia archaeon]
MTDLSNQRRLAADILGVGIKRVWLNPELVEEIAAALTREDIRGLIESGAIKRKQKKGVSRGRARMLARKRAKGHRKGHGSRKGTKKARFPKKRAWIIKIRALRRKLRELRDSGEIDASTYRKLYNKAKGGEFRDVAHLESYIRGR